MSTKPWDIYAEQLFPVGYGHPLWIPEPDENTSREVHLGDVGWLKDGEFRPLFNSMRDEGDPINRAKSVPRGFQVFSPPNLSIGRSHKIKQQPVFSRSIRATESRVEAVGDSGVAPASAGVGWGFETATDAGALVMLDLPGVSEDIESKRHIVNYMRGSFDSWVEFANATWGLDLRDQDIIFVCGTLKTTQWAVAAFQGNKFRKKEGYVSGQPGSFGNAEFSVQISNQVLPTSNCRTGPLQPAQVNESHLLSYPGYPSSSVPSPSRVSNQCLFIHYFKMKRRLWWKEAIQAGAGPHQLPPGSDNEDEDGMMHEGGSSPYEFETEAPTRDDGYDPVNHLLDYIFLNSEADIAVASDLDLIALFNNREFPNNILEGIMQLSPSIEVDENGVGTISVDFAFGRKRNDRGDGGEEEYAREEKRPRYPGHDYSAMAHSSDLQQAYGSWNPAGPSYAVPYGAMGGASCYPQAPRGMHSQEGMLYHPDMEYAQDIAFQQGMSYPQGMQYAGRTGYPQDTPYPQYHMPPPGYGLPPAAHYVDMYAAQEMLSSSGGMQSMPQGYYAPPPQNTSFPPAFPAAMPYAPHGGMHPSARGDDSDGGSDSDNDDDNDSGDDSDDDDDTEGEPGDKPTGKRPEWGAPTSVHDGSVTALAYSADGKYVASGSEDTMITIWNARENAVRHKVPLANDTGHADTISALAFSRDNVFLASASHDEEVIIWAVANGRVHLRLASGLAVYSLAYTPDEKYLIAGASDGSLHLWDALTYEKVKTVERDGAVVTFILFSKDGRLMATGGTESVCHIWETANLLAGRPLSVLTGHRGMVCAAAFDRDCRRIVTASDDGSSRIWNAETGEDLFILHEHTGPVWTIAFSPDGKRVASGSSDSTVKICDSYTGERQLSLDGHDGMINMVEFSPDGRYIASAASDNMVRLWNVRDGSNRTTYNEHNDNVTTVMFASDGSALASGSHDGTVRIRPLMVAPPPP